MSIWVISIFMNSTSMHDLKYVQEFTVYDGVDWREGD